MAYAALHRCLLERGVRARLRSAAVLWRALGGGPLELKGLAAAV